MATIEQLSNALIKADAEGDTEGATILAKEIRRMQAEETGGASDGEQVAKDGRIGTDQPQAPAQGGSSLQDYASAGLTWVEGLSDLPVAGPALRTVSDFIGSNISGLVTGEDPAKIRAAVQARRETRKEQYPLSNISGQIAGTLTPMGMIGRTAAGAEALGMTGAKLLPRIRRSASSSALISGADTAARGGDVHDVGASAAVGSVIGAAIPVGGRAIERGISAVADRIYPTVNAALRPEQEAARRVGMALARDAKADPKSIMSATDETVARQNNIPVVNADRGGETTRALARSVANQSPEARATIEKTASDRFGAQSQRAAEFIRRLTSGNMDDIGMQQAIRDTARFVNKPAYDRAFSSPPAQQLFTPRLQELMQSPSMRRAVAKVPARSADRGAVEGFKEIGNPFSMNSKGSYVLRQKANGELVAPTLQFWDQVKRNLDGEIGKAARAGDNTLKADLTALKNRLVDELDTAVPAYRAARRGAASYFDAEDAMEAGKKFATTPRLVPEAMAAFEKFTPVEKNGFAIGYASELIDRIKASGDRTNVINSVFKSQSARESMELVFGPKKAKEVEAYVRVEDLVDRMRGAMGNSTTARQLVELGIGAGGGYAATGDWAGALTGAALARGARHVGQRVDAKVMQRVANMLMSDKRGNLQLAVHAAARNPGYMRALEDLGNALAIPSRAAGVTYAQ